MPDKLNTQYGGQVTRFGNHKLKILEWMHSLLYLKNDEICKKFQEIELAKSLLILMKSYDMNSLLHLKIFKIFSDSIDINNDLWIETVIKYIIICKYSLQ